MKKKLIFKILYKIRVVFYTEEIAWETRAPNRENRQARDRPELCCYNLVISFIDYNHTPNIHSHSSNSKF